jgi:hypothetical protein
MKIHFLGELPLDPNVRVGGDTGSPVALKNSGHGFRELAQALISRVAEVAQQSGPKIEVTD